MPEAKPKTVAELIEAVAAVSLKSEACLAGSAGAKIWKLVWTLNGPILIYTGIADGLRPGLAFTMLGAVFILGGVGAIVFGFHWWRLENNLKRAHGHWSLQRRNLLHQLEAAKD